MPRKTIAEVYKRFLKRTSHLVSIFDYQMDISKSYASVEEVNKYIRSFILIRLHVAWANFCRELIINSAIGGHNTASGILLSKGTAVTDWNSIRLTLQNQSRTYHIPWHIAHHSLRIAQILGIQNYNQVSSALGSPSHIDCILAMRNFLTHPNEVSKMEYDNALVNIGINYRIEPLSLLKTRVTGGASLFGLWVSELQNMAESSIQ